jgi:hypothetical protein
LSGRLLLLLLVQALYVAVGLGLLPLLGIARTRSALCRRIGLAYIVGVASTGVLAAHAALVRVPFGLLELALLASVSLALGLRRIDWARSDRAPKLPRRPRTPLGAANAALAAATSGALLVLLAHAAHAYATRPLDEWDGWAIWATKARALYEFGGAYKPVFTTYQPVAHPLLLPAIEALDARAMGAFDGTLLHVQLLTLACGFAAALWSLLGERLPGALIGASLLALLTAPPLLDQLSSNLADVPLAFFFALGIVSLGRFLVAGERWTLVTAALFLGAAMLTKSEGALFAAAAFAAAAATLALGRGWRRLGQLVVASLAAVALLVPWRIFLAVNHLRNPEYTLSGALHPGYLASRGSRVSPAAFQLWHALSSSAWGLLVPLVLVSILSAVLAGRWWLALFAVLWPTLGFVGLVVVYWISVVPVGLTLAWTAGRVVDSLIVGSAALAPLLIGEAWRAGAAAEHADPRLVEPVGLAGARH